jgi:hypothetical protein
LYLEGTTVRTRSADGDRYPELDEV